MSPRACAETVLGVGVPTAGDGRAGAPRDDETPQTDRTTRQGPTTTAADDTGGCLGGQTETWVSWLIKLEKRTAAFDELSKKTKTEGQK
mmetsp:Transcript_5327/g.21973  ORF Transcript_5327/g.21973 Transcript_5327/m.21973 type:complete len:89 (-) Transcript_5327:855-1121(-)